VYNEKGKKMPGLDVYLCKGKKGIYLTYPMGHEEMLLEPDDM
jgi:hypothetical protein